MSKIGNGVGAGVGTGTKDRAPDGNSGVCNDQGARRRRWQAKQSGCLAATATATGAVGRALSRNLMS